MPKSKRKALPPTKPNGSAWKDLRRRKWKQQGGKCQICRKEIGGPDEPTAHLDHCHTKAAGGDFAASIRGVLCGACNFGLGHFCDDVRVMQRAIRYLQLHGGPALDASDFADDGLVAAVAQSRYAAQVWADDLVLARMHLLEQENDALRRRVAERQGTINRMNVVAPHIPAYEWALAYEKAYPEVSPRYDNMIATSHAA